MAREQLAEAEGTKMFNHTIVNRDLDESYAALKRIISTHRPDIIPPPPTVPHPSPDDPTPVGTGSAAANAPVLVLAGPPGAGAVKLHEALLRMFPAAFVEPQRVTDRKPAKKEATSAAMSFVSPKDFVKLVAEGQLVWSELTGREKGAPTVAITAQVSSLYRLC